MPAVASATLAPAPQGATACRPVTAVRPPGRAALTGGARATATENRSLFKPSFSLLALRRPGGHCGAAAPDPIPNSAVKRPSAYDTSSQDAGKSVAARSAKRKHHPPQKHPATPLAPHRRGALCVLATAERRDCARPPTQRPRDAPPQGRRIKSHLSTLETLMTTVVRRSDPVNGRFGAVERRRLGLPTCPPASVTTRRDQSDSSLAVASAIILLPFQSTTASCLNARETLFSSSAFSISMPSPARHRLYQRERTRTRLGFPNRMKSESLMANGGLPCRDPSRSALISMVQR